MRSLVSGTHYNAVRRYEMRHNCREGRQTLWTMGGKAAYLGDRFWIFRDSIVVVQPEMRCSMHQGSYTTSIHISAASFACNRRKNTSSS
jgi:hypothetical protein